MVRNRNPRQRQGANPLYQASLIRRAMSGGLTPISGNKFNNYASPFLGGNNRRGPHQRYAAQYPHGVAYGPRFGGRQPHFRGYGSGQSPYSRHASMGGYSGGYGAGFPGRRSMYPTYSGYGRGPSAYRNPYTGAGYGVRPRQSYSRPSYSMLGRRMAQPMMRRGYPPSSRRPTQWYNDMQYSDEEEYDYDDPCDESEFEDDHYGNGYGHHRVYATEYDDSEWDEDYNEDNEYDEDEEDDYGEYDRHGGYGYGAHQYRGERDDW